MGDLVIIDAQVPDVLDDILDKLVLLLGWISVIEPDKALALIYEIRTHINVRSSHTMQGLRVRLAVILKSQDKLSWWTPICIAEYDT
jgi:hypothetical protein